MSWPVTLAQAVDVIQLHLPPELWPADHAVLLDQIADAVGLGEGQNPQLLAALGATDAVDAARLIVTEIRGER